MMMNKTTILRSTLLLILMVFVARTGLAEDRVGNTLVYDFTKYSGNYTFTEGGTVKNSKGETMTILKDATYGATGTRFAVANSLIADSNGNNYWFSNNGGLLCHFSGSRALSIMGLKKGDIVTITWNKAEAGQADITSRGSETLATTETNEVYTTTCTMEKSESLDLMVGRNNKITRVVINDGGTTNHVSFDTTGKTGDHSYNSGPSYPYYKSQLSARNFVEPAISVYPSTAEVTYTVTNYGESTRAGEKSVAVMNENPAQKNDVLFKNIGWCKVTASITVGENTYSDSYVVWIWDNLASYTLEDNGTKYRLNGAGVLENRVVTAVPGMTMTFGIPFNYPANGDYMNSVVNNSTEPYDFNYTTDNSNYNYQPNSVVVASVNNDDHFVSFIPADNGWWDRYPYRSDRFPYQGTFYTFTAKASGTLTVGGYRSANNDVIWKNRNTLADGSILKDNQGNNLVIAESKEIPMNAGQIYIIHGVTPHITSNDYWNTTTGWAVFELEWFKFESNFKIVDPANPSVEKLYGVASECGATSVTSREKITITGISDISAAVTVKEGSISWKGTITGATVTINSDGTMTFSNIAYNTSEANKKGGAIKVTIKNGENEIDFVMTIPYGKHVWDFRKDGEQGTRKGDWTYTDAGLVSMMNSNGTDWSRVFKVASKSGGEWTELIDPIMAARGSINGNNAFYMDNTAGLVFVTGPESFGAHETSNSTANYSSLTNDQKYNLSYTTTSGADLLWIKGTATIYFPGVTAGQYIKIYTYRHSDNKGENFYAKNLVDLDDKTYNTTSAENFFKLRGINDNRYPAYKGDDIKGAAIFRVPTDYEATNNPSAIPSLTLCDDGWAHIYRIEIMSNYEPDLILTMDGAKDVNGNTINLPVDYNSPLSSITVRKKMNAGGTYDYTPVTKTFTATPGNTRCQSANTCRYVVDATGLTVTTTRSNFNSGAVDYNKLELTFGGGTGLVKITQREIANHTGYAYNNTTGTTGDGEFTIDKNEYYLAVGELTVQDYPFTWDFTAYNKGRNDASKTALKTASEADEGTFGRWSDDGNSSDYTQNISASVPMTGHATLSVNKPIAIQGSELTALTTPLREMEGLGISLPYSTTNSTYTTFYTENSSFGKHEHGYQVYNITGNIKNTQEDLRGVGTITIPEVDNGMYIFVKSSEGLSVKTADGTTLYGLWSGANNDPFDMKAGVYLFQQNTGSKQDVTITYSSAATIYNVAVTNIVKSINALGYATESRDHAIDHTYQEKFTNHPVKAYAITTYEGTTYNYNGFTQVKKSYPVSVVPATTGIVLYQENASAAFQSPMFYPAVNVEPTESDNVILETNWMAPNVTEKVHGSETICKYHAMAGAPAEHQHSGACLWCTKFIMSRYYYTYDQSTHSNGSLTEGNYEAFYRMKLGATSEANTFGANKAYLLIQTVPTAVWNSGSNNAPSGIIFMDLENVGNETTAIEEALFSEEDSSKDIYYSLSGVRIIGTPTTKGIYIKNGKKVSIK